MLVGPASRHTLICPLGTFFPLGEKRVLPRRFQYPLAVREHYLLDKRVPRAADAALLATVTGTGMRELVVSPPFISPLG